MRSLLLASAMALLLAPSSQAAEILGTIVSSDAGADTFVVRTQDGRIMTIRTGETTRIQRGDSVVETTTLIQGTPVQIVTTDVVTGETAVVPTATRIVLVPAAPAEDDDDVDIDIGDDDDDDGDDD